MKLATTMPTIIMAAVTTTGLSPEFHLAFFKNGTAGAFFVFDLSSQSVKSHCSTLRLSSSSASRNSSRYSFTSPLDLDSANLVRDTGTTCVFQTMAAATQSATMTPIPTSVLVSGRIGSNDVAGCCSVTVVDSRSMLDGNGNGNGNGNDGMDDDGRTRA